MSSGTRLALRRTTDGRWRALWWAAGMTSGAARGLVIASRRRRSECSVGRASRRTSGAFSLARPHAVVRATATLALAIATAVALAGSARAGTVSVAFEHSP